MHPSIPIKAASVKRVARLQSTLHARMHPTTRLFLAL
jgi:hypothetical protein